MFRIGHGHTDEYRFRRTITDAGTDRNRLYHPSLFPCSSVVVRVFWSFLFRESLLGQPQRR